MSEQPATLTPTPNESNSVSGGRIFSLNPIFGKLSFMMKLHLSA